MPGAALLLLLDNVGTPRRGPDRERAPKVFGEVEWITIFFFIGLFMVVAGVEHAGVLELARGRARSR